jgi:hypothetical protein
MMRIIFILACIFLFQSIALKAQTTKQKVFTEDIDHFWEAFDSVAVAGDSAGKVQLIQRLYIDRGSEGLHAFMKARDYSAVLYAYLIKTYPKFWASVRANTLAAKTKGVEIEKSILRFKQLYPGLKDANMYFTIGGLRSGGTTDGSNVLIGSEIATADPHTDVSELPNRWLAGVFREQSLDNLVYLNIHEYVHTQQVSGGSSLLASCIEEGACDFIAEKVMGTPIQRNYINYGRLHEAELKKDFLVEMFAPDHSRWLANGGNAPVMADLGYFMGYAICSAYYNASADKSKAISEIINLNYNSEAAVEAFLAKSGYFPEQFDKSALLQQYKEKVPVIVRVDPFGNGSKDVDPSLTEMRIVFSKEMKPGVSINYSGKGKEAYPLTEAVGYQPDQKTFILKMALQPMHEYEFVISPRRFLSKEGFPLADEYTVRFKTK